MGAPMQGTEAEKAKKTNADLKRAFLFASTLGTSEIKTGAGEYGDETLADSIFPKTVNNLMLDDREAARKATDKAKADMAAPPNEPDLADRLLQGTAAGALLKQKTKTGRKSAFLLGAMGEK